MRIVAETANIYTKPNESSEVALQAREGEVFGIWTRVDEKEEGDWYRVEVDSTGNQRFLHRSLAEKVDKPVLALSTESRRNVCLEQDEARRRVNSEVGNLDMYHLGLLQDRYWVEIARKYGIQPAMNLRDLGCSEFFPGRSAASRVTGVLLRLMAITGPFVGVGLLCVFGIVRRRAEAEGSGSIIKWRVFSLAALYGTLMSAVLIAMGTGVVFSLIIPAAMGGGLLLFPIVFGILGVLIVLSYIWATQLVLRSATRSGQT